MNSDNQEFSQQLLTKLRMLIAVIEVAILKLNKAMDGEGADKQRLKQIRSNLQNTLRICFTARNTLEKKMGIVREFDEDVVDVPPLNPSEEETKIMPVDRPAITLEDITGCDIHELSRQLGKL